MAKYGTPSPPFCAPFHWFPFLLSSPLEYGGVLRHAAFSLFSFPSPPPDGGLGRIRMSIIPQANGPSSLHSKSLLSLFVLYPYYPAALFFFFFLDVVKHKTRRHVFPPREEIVAQLPLFSFFSYPLANDDRTVRFRSPSLLKA